MRKPHAILGSYGREMCVAARATGPGAGLFGPCLRGIEWKILFCSKTELGGVFRPRPLREIEFSFSQCTSSYYALLHRGDAIVNTLSGLVVKTPPNRILGGNIVPHSINIIIE